MEFEQATETTINRVTVRVDSVKLFQWIFNCRSAILAVIGLGLVFGASGCSGIDRNPATGFQHASIRRRSGQNVTLLMAQQQYEQGDFQAAYQAARVLRRRNPTSIDARRLEAQSAFDLGLRQESLHAWKSVTVLPVKSPEILHEAGLNLVQLGAVSSGLRALKLAAEKAPERVEYHLDLSAAYLESGNVHTAQAVLLQAHRRHTSDSTVPVAVARLFEHQGNWNRAAHYYGVALTAAPDNPTWLRQHGRANYRLGNWRLAQQDFSQCEQAMTAGKHWMALLEYADTCLKSQSVNDARRIASTLNENAVSDTRLSRLNKILAELPNIEPQMVASQKPEPASTPIKRREIQAVSETQELQTHRLKPQELQVRQSAHTTDAESKIELNDLAEPVTASEHEPKCGLEPKCSAPLTASAASNRESGWKPRKWRQRLK